MRASICTRGRAPLDDQKLGRRDAVPKRPPSGGCKPCEHQRVRPCAIRSTPPRRPPVDHRASRPLRASPHQTTSAERLPIRRLGFQSEVHPSPHPTSSSTHLLIHPSPHPTSSSTHLLIRAPHPPISSSTLIRPGGCVRSPRDTHCGKIEPLGQTVGSSDHPLSAHRTATASRTHRAMRAARGHDSLGALRPPPRAPRRVSLWAPPRTPRRAPS